MTIEKIITAKAPGSVDRLVICQNCNHRFHYTLSRRGEGSTRGELFGRSEGAKVVAMDIAEAPPEANGLGEFAGVSSGLLGQEDLEEAASVLEPGTVAAVLVWENLWAAPIAVALRRSGGQLVASGRIPVQAILAALDALEATDQ